MEAIICWHFLTEAIWLERKGRGGHKRGQWTLWGPQWGERWSHERTRWPKSSNEKMKKVCSLRPSPHMKHVWYLLFKIWMIRWVLFKPDHSDQWERHPGAADGTASLKYPRKHLILMLMPTYSCTQKPVLIEEQKAAVDRSALYFRAVSSNYKLGWQDLVKLLVVTASDSFFIFLFYTRCVFNFRGVGVCLGRARPAISPWLFARKWIIICPEMLKWTQKGRGREVKKRWAIQWQKRVKTMKRGEDGQSSEQGLPCRNGFPSMAG